MNVMQTLVMDLRESENQPWQIEPDGYIRTKYCEGHQSLCPIEAVWLTRNGNERFGACTLGEELGIPVTVKLDIITAADNGLDEPLRRLGPWRGVLLKLLNVPPEQ